MTNILITGITGFTGSHLAEYLLGKGNIFGTVRGRCRQTEFIDHIKNKLTLLECDLTDYNSVQATIEDSEPDVIFHFGAITFIPTSWRAPQETIETNVLGTLNILETIRKSKYNPKILISSSSEVYGLVKKNEIPIKETNQLRPLSPYAVSKVAQDLLGYQYFQSYGMKIIRTRAFNLMGPRSGEKIMTAAFAKQIAEIEKGIREPTIEVGNLDAVRDLNDIRDVVRAYDLAVKKCDYGDVYNVATGIGTKIQDILSQLMLLSNTKVNITWNDKLMRPSDVPILIGDSTKFRKKTGWEPQIRFQKSLSDILLYWRNK